MEPIQSGEIFPNAVLKQGEPPPHTVEGHAGCAYYPKANPQCEHGEVAAGGFYSEDYVRELKQTLHPLIAFIDANVEFKLNGFSRDGRLERKYISTGDIAEFASRVETLRELTK